MKDLQRSLKIRLPLFTTRKSELILASNSALRHVNVRLCLIFHDHVEKQASLTRIDPVGPTNLKIARIKNPLRFETYALRSRKYQYVFAVIWPSHRRFDGPKPVS